MGKLAATKLSKKERAPWLLTPLPPMRPHSADPNLAKRPEKEHCRVLAASFNPHHLAARPRHGQEAGQLEAAGGDY